MTDASASRTSFFGLGKKRSRGKSARSISGAPSVGARAGHDVQQQQQQHISLSAAAGAATLAGSAKDGVSSASGTESDVWETTSLCDGYTRSIAEHGALSLAGVSPSGELVLERPDDPTLINKLFAELMSKRDFKNFPEAAKRQMNNYSLQKKWMLIYADAVAEFNELRKRQHMNLEDDATTPEWYVRRIMESSISLKELSSLSVSLRTQPIAWMRQFLDCQGQVALIKILSVINRNIDKTSRCEGDNEKEFEIVRCLKTLLNSKYGADDAMKHRSCVPAIAASILSPHISTRKTVAEVLTFLCHWEIPRGHNRVFEAFERLRVQFNEATIFDGWMTKLETTVDGRGILGSMVSASDEYRVTGGSDAALMEYALANLFLINSLANEADDLKLRVHIRGSFRACGLARIAVKLAKFKHDLIDRQILQYEKAEIEDLQDLVEGEQQPVQSFKPAIMPNIPQQPELDGEIQKYDFNHEPAGIVMAIWNRLQGSRAQGHFLSTLKQFALIHDEGEDRNYLFKLLESILSQIVKDGRSRTRTPDAQLHISVQRLLDRLHTDEEYAIAVSEARDAKLKADKAVLERDELRKQIELGTDGLVTRLTKEIDDQARVIEAQRRANETLRMEIEDLHRHHMKELKTTELETRELYMIIRDAQNGSDVNMSSGILDRQKLMSKLERLLERKKAEFKLEGKTWRPDDFLYFDLKTLQDDVQLHDTVMTAQESTKDTKTVSSVFQDKKTKISKTIEKVAYSDTVKDDICFSKTGLNEQPSLPPNSAKSHLKSLQPLTDIANHLAVSLPEAPIRCPFKIISGSNENLIDDDQALMLRPLPSTPAPAPPIPPLHSEDGLGRKLNVSNALPRNVNDTEDLGYKHVSTPFSKTSFSATGEYPKGRFVPHSEKDIKIFKSEASAPPPPPPPLPVALPSGTFIPPSVKIEHDRNGAVNGLQQLPSPPPPTPPPPPHQAPVALSSGIYISPVKIKRDDTMRVSGIQSVPPPAPPVPVALPGGTFIPPSIKTSDWDNSADSVDFEPPPPPPPPPLPPPLSISGDVTQTLNLPPPPPPLPGVKENPINKPAETEEVYEVKHSGKIGQTGLPFVCDDVSRQLIVTRPAVKLKPMHWERVDHGIDYTMWSHLKLDANELADVLRRKGILDEIDRVFAAKDSKIRMAKKRADKKTIMPIDMANKFEVSLHSFANFPVMEVVLKILHCDKEVHGSENIMTFLSDDKISDVENMKTNLMPYRTDWRGRGKHTDTKDHAAGKELDPESLSRNDRIYLELFFNLDYYWRSRMRALNLQRNFENQYEDYSRKIQLLQTAAENVRSSQKLRELFDVMLFVGNYMNDRGRQAAGFKLDSLQRMQFTKDERNLTFLHHVERLVRTTFPGIADFADDIKACKEAAVLSVKDLEKECKEFIESVAIVQRSFDSGSLSDPEVFHPEDRLIVTVVPFLPGARAKASMLKELFESTMTSYEGTLRYFGEDPNEPLSRVTFFRKFSVFLSNYQTAQKENVAREEQMRSHESRKKYLDGYNKSKQSGSAEDDEDSKIMDDLLAKLRTAPDSSRLRRRGRGDTTKNKQIVLNKSTSMLLNGLIDDPLPDTQEMTSCNSNTESETGSLSNEPDIGSDGLADVAAKTQSMLAALRKGSTNISETRHQQEKVND